VGEERVTITVRDPGSRSAGFLFGGVVRMLTSKRYTFAVPLCGLHQRKRRQELWQLVGVFGGFLAFLVIGSGWYWNEWEGALILGAFFGLGFLVAGYSLRRQSDVVRVLRVTTEGVHLQVSQQFVITLK